MSTYGIASPTSYLAMSNPCLRMSSNALRRLSSSGVNTLAPPAAVTSEATAAAGATKPRPLQNLLLAGMLLLSCTPGPMCMLCCCCCCAVY